MRLYREYGHRIDDATIQRISAELQEKPELIKELIAAGIRNTQFESLNYRERRMVSAHLGFCMECYATHYYDKDDLDEDGNPKRKPVPKEAFIDIALDHGLASPDTADKTYRRALAKMKEKLKDL